MSQDRAPFGHKLEEKDAFLGEGAVSQESVKSHVAQDDHKEVRSRVRALRTKQQNLWLSEVCRCGISNWHPSMLPLF